MVDPQSALPRTESSGNTLRASQRANGERRPAPSDLSFSFLSSDNTSLLECVLSIAGIQELVANVHLASLVALDRMQLSEWLDGINALRNEPARVVATAETKEIIDQLTDLGLKVRSRAIPLD